MDDPPFVALVVTCRTQDCANADQAITVDVPDTASPSIVCGVCHQPITDTRAAS